MKDRKKRLILLREAKERRELKATEAEKRVDREEILGAEQKLDGEIPYLSDSREIVVVPRPGVKTTKSYLKLQIIKVLSLIVVMIIVFTGLFSIIKERQFSSDGLEILHASEATSIIQPTESGLAQTALSTPTAINQREINIWIDSSVPSLLSDSIQYSDVIIKANSSQESDIRVGVVNEGVGDSTWIFALVAPFPTVVDGMSSEDIRIIWSGEEAESFEGENLLISEKTKNAFEKLWGPASNNKVIVIDEQNILELAWSEQPSFAIIPFEKLEPKWKVLRVDGLSPLDKKFDSSVYSLVVNYGLSGGSQSKALIERLSEEKEIIIPKNNRDPNKMSVLVMTGVTAMVRYTGVKMEELGMTYPGKDIQYWLREADLTHISNEVSFDPNCPPPKKYLDNLQFCSRPEYIELLEYVGADIIELSGNHLLDWGYNAFIYTLEMYEERGWYYYAGGINLEEASKAIKIENNGNRIAFIGCNPHGPGFVWATDEGPGVANCDFPWIEKEIQSLREEGYLPIMTFQYHESSGMIPGLYQEKDFSAMAKAGAVIVSGSQAHIPQGMDFVESTFIHYGLGNLFFDQMNHPISGTRREFIDRHVFYDGRYISTELLTAMLEDYARPRPMTPEERKALLQDAFQASEW